MRESDAERQKEKKGEMRKRERKREGETDIWHRQRIERKNSSVCIMELGGSKRGGRETREIDRKRKERKFMHRR